VERIQELLAQIGLEPERVRMENMSAAMAGKFVEVAKEMKEQIAQIGPNPLRIDDSANQRESQGTDDRINDSARNEAENQQTGK
jgi:ribosomal protein L12E/L44/L45/RPP1/RPP2